MTAVSAPQPRLAPEDASFSIADVSDQVGVGEAIRDEPRSESGRQSRSLEEGVAIEVTLARRGRLDVLPIVHENEKLRIAAGRPKTTNDLDPDPPGLDREVAHVVMLGNKAPRGLIVDVVRDAGNELPSLSMVDEGEVAGHDGDRASGFEETGHNGCDDGVGRVKDHGNLESVGKLVGEKRCPSPDKLL